MLAARADNRPMRRLLEPFVVLAGAWSALVTASAALAANPAAGTMPGAVGHVIDGDSVRFVPADATVAPIEVRLRDIDAPEGCQAWGREARAALAERTLGRSAVLVATGRDSWGRTLGRIVVDGVDVAPQFVADGHAWSHRTRWDQGPLVKQETAARALGRGLHAGGRAEPPWQFRRRHGPCNGGPAADARGVGIDKPAALPQPPAATPTAPANASVVGGDFAQRCDGRRRCSQMQSCAEAKWFLANCPAMEMDGDGNGVPCERQWCARDARR